MLVNGTQNRKIAGRTPGGVHLPPGGRAVRECRPGPGRKGQFCLLALRDADRVYQPDKGECVTGDNRTVGAQTGNPVEKGCKLAIASIHEHIQGGPQPGRPI